MGFRRNWLALLFILFLTVPSYGATISGGGGGHTIYDESSPLTQKPNLKFTGTDIACEDGTGGDSTKTVCTVQYGVSPSTLYVKGHTYPAELNDMLWFDNSASGWSDSSGNCIFGNCLTFDGTNDYVEVSHHTDLNPTGAMTIEAWVKTTSATDQIVVGKDDASTLRAYFMAINTSTCLPRALFFQADATYTTATGTTPVCDGKWHHLAGTVTSTGSGGDGYARMYIDGVLSATGTVAITSIQVENVSTFIGYRPSASYYMTGSIDDVRIWSVARTAAEIKADMDNVLTGSETNLVGYWNFDEGSGTTAADSAGTAQDGTLTNMASPATETSGWHTITACKLGSQCLSFDGSDDYVKIYGYDIIPSGSNARTVEAWVYPTSSTARSVIFSYGASSDNNLISFEVNGWQAAENGKLVFRTRNNAVASTTSLTLNAWNWVAFTLNGTATSIAGTDTTLNTSDDALELYVNSSTPETLVAITGMGNTGTINTTSAQAVIGKDIEDKCRPGLGGCVRFDGTDDYIAIADHSDLEPGTGVTLTAWIYMRALPSVAGTLIAKYNVAGQREYELRIQSDGTLAYLYNGTSIATTKSIDLNRWVFVAATESTIGASGAGKIYIDASLEAAGAVTGTIPGTRTSSVTIGGNDNLGYYFNGSMDDVRIYVDALSRQDIWYIWNYGYQGGECSGAETSIRLCLRLNEGSGTTANDFAGTAQNGTLTNFSSTTQDFDTDGWQNNGYFAGGIDDVAIWDVALTGATTPTIAARYNSGSGTELAGTESGLKLYYKFNDALTNTILATQSATISGLGSDSNSCQTSGSPCLTIAGALSKIGSKFYSNNINIYISSGVYNEQVDLHGYHPAGPYAMTMTGTFNATPNSFTDTPVYSNTSNSGSNTNNFPKDARSLFNDTSKTFGSDVIEGWLRICGSTCTSTYDYTEWYPIEYKLDKDTVSIVGHWTAPASSDDYEIYDANTMTVIHGGAKPGLLPIDTAAGNGYDMGNSNAFSIKDTSGLTLRKFRIQNTGNPTGCDAPCGHAFYTNNSIMDEVTVMSAYKARYAGFDNDYNSAIIIFDRNIASDSYEGMKNEHISTINSFKNNFAVRNSNCGFCNFFQSPVSYIQENLFKQVAYGCLDGEQGFFSYLTGYNRMDTCGSDHGAAMIVGGMSMINLIYPNTFKNSIRGIQASIDSSAQTFLQAGTATDIEFLYNDIGITASHGGALQGDILNGTFTGNTTAKQLVDSFSDIMINPTLSSCGTNPAVTNAYSSNRGGVIKVGTGTATSCTITFGATWPEAPSCTANIDSTTITLGIATTTTALTVTSSATMATKIIKYVCSNR